MAQTNMVSRADGTASLTTHGTDDRPDENSENDLLRLILEELRQMNLYLEMMLTP